MTSAQNESQALGDLAARQLANATKTVPQLSTITPRWLLHLLSWVPVEAGIYRVNRVVNPEQVAVKSEDGAGSEGPLPETYVDYETSPREYTLRTIATLLDIHTRVSDLYSSPHDQVTQQLRLTIETIKERQEFELVNSPEYGLLAQATPEQTIQTLRFTYGIHVEKASLVLLQFSQDIEASGNASIGRFFGARISHVFF